MRRAPVFLGLVPSTERGSGARASSPTRTSGARCGVALAVALAATMAARRVHAEPPAASHACGTENLLAGKLPVEAQDVSGVPALVTDGSVGPEGTLWDAPVGV